MAISITGTGLMIMGSIDFDPSGGGTKIGTSAILVKSQILMGIGPVMIPPPPSGDLCPCGGPGGDVECVMTPATMKVGGVEVVIMGSMYTQDDSGNAKVCQPMMAMSAETVIHNTPILTENSSMMIMGMLNGMGAMP